MGDSEGKQQQETEEPNGMNAADKQKEGLSITEKSISNHENHSAP
jgi:hypothetical protein